MSDLFEELIWKFAEASNAEAGEHFTPRDPIRLMVELLFAADDEALQGLGVVRSVYDPAAGTGGTITPRSRVRSGPTQPPRLPLRPRRMR